MKFYSNLLIMADCLFMIIIKELLIEMKASQSLVPMEVGDIKKCIWVGQSSHYRFFNHKVNIVKVIGCIDEVGFIDRLIHFRFVFIY